MGAWTWEILEGLSERQFNCKLRGFSPVATRDVVSCVSLDMGIVL